MPSCKSCHGTTRRMSFRIYIMNRITFCTKVYPGAQALAFFSCWWSGIFAKMKKRKERKERKERKGEEKGREEKRGREL